MPHCDNHASLVGGKSCGAHASLVGGNQLGGNRYIRHSNRKIHKKRRKTLRKFLSKKRRSLLKTLKRTFKYKKSNKKRKSKRRPTKKRRPMKKRMRGGAPLSPALFSNEAARVDPNIIDSATYSVGDNLNGESALANPPPVVRTNGCLV